MRAIAFLSLNVTLTSDHSEVLRRTAVLGAIAALSTAACSNEQPTSALAPNGVTNTIVADSVQPSIEPSSQHSILEPARLSLEVSGAIELGRPVRISVHLAAKRTSATATLRMEVSSGGARPLAEIPERLREVALVAGQIEDRSLEVTFDLPGYYYVSAAVFADWQGSLASDGSVVLPSAHASGWILISPDGTGRFDRGYDLSLHQAGKPFLRYGATGDFLNENSGIRARASLAHSMSNPVMAGILTYISGDTITFGQRLPIPSARIDGACYIGSASAGSYSAVTDPQGAFSFSCPAGSTSYQGQAKLESANVRTYLVNFSSPSNISFSIAANSTDTVTHEPNASVVFNNHNKYNLQANALFGRSRGQMRYVVDPSNYNSNAYYPTTDHIEIHNSGIWNSYGRFAVTHEYGHAFHFRAIDPPSAPKAWDVCPNPHGYTQATTSWCAYTEGVASFFAHVMLRNDVLSYQNPGLDNWRTESNLEATAGLGQGLNVEGLFARLLWDMFDDASTPDGITGDDDSMTMSAAQIADIMLNCRMHSPNSYLLGYSDQFVYCAEGGVNNARYVAPAAYQSAWGLYGTLTWDAPTSRPALADFRPRWLYNLYGI